MAVSSTIEYCSERDLKDIYPGLSGFDTKIRIHGWVSLGNSLYRANNVGLVTKLFKDGEELVSDFTSLITTSNLATDTGQDVSSAYGFDATTVGVDDASDSDIKNGQFYKINNEIVFQYSESSNDLSLIRGLFGTTPANFTTSHDVYHSDETLDTDFDWAYDKYTDSIFMYSSTDPNNSIMESGEDWTTLKTRQVRNASRYLEAKIDGRLSREIWKDREGNYPYIIKRTTALIAVTFLIRADEPISPIADAFIEEADSNIEQLNSGSIQLPNAVTYDSSKGIIRDVTYTSGSIRPVKTRGAYSGTFDLIKISIGTGGVLGTATFNAYEKDGTKLKNNQIVTNKVITGDYQMVASNLYIRFAGGTDSSVATANDEWELELYGYSERTSTTGLGVVKMSRGGYGKGAYRPSIRSKRNYVSGKTTNISK